MNNYQYDIFDAASRDEKNEKSQSQWQINQILASTWTYRKQICEKFLKCINKSKVMRVTILLRNWNWK